MKKRLDSKAVLVSQSEVERRRRTHFDARANFAVDNISVNPETRHIFDNYIEGHIATRDEVRDLLRAHYLSDIDQ